MAHWLLKSEPETFGIEHLKAKTSEPWDGVRNYTARNNLMAMKVGEEGFFYHSSCDVPGVVGVLRIVREAYPDPSQFDPNSKYFDAKATEAKPRWFCPDVAYVKTFARVVSLREIKQTPGLQDMVVASATWSRLSVSPVTDKEWDIMCELAERPE
jgi:predicted RNA-binding protein with PUA-like domain